MGFIAKKASSAGIFHAARPSRAVPRTNLQKVHAKSG